MRKIYFFLALLMSISLFGINNSSLNPLNDHFSESKEITIANDGSCTIINGTLENATPTTEITSDVCLSNTTPDVWYKFTATSSTFSFKFTSDQSTSASLYFGNSVQTLSTVLCRFSNTDLNGLVVGRIYYLRISNHNNSAFSFCIKSIPNRPTNDECINAENISVSNAMTCNTTIAGTVENATSNITSVYSQNCANYPDAKDVWYQFTATSKTLILNAVENSESFQVAFGLYTGSCNTLQCGANGMISYSPGFTSKQLLKDLIIGQQYFLRIYDIPSSNQINKSFKLCLSTPPGVINDNASAAKLISASPNLGCGDLVTEYLGLAQPTSPMPVTGCSADFQTHENSPDRWYTFTAVSPEHVVFFYNDNVDYIINDVQLFSGASNNLICHAKPEKEIGTFKYGTYLFKNLVVDEKYHLRIVEDSFNSLSTYTFCIKTPLPKPQNDHIENALNIIPSNDLWTCNLSNQFLYNRATTEAQTLVPSCNDFFEAQNGDVWFKFTATDSKYQLNIFTASPDSGYQNYKTVLYKKTNGNLSEVYCFDAFTEQHISSQGASIANGNYYPITLQNYTNLEIGETYFIRLYNSSLRMDGLLTHLIEMPYQICLKKYPEIPANDLPINAVNLEMSTNESCNFVQGHTTRADFEYIAPFIQCAEGSYTSPMFNNLGSDVWYKFTATAPSHKITINNFATVPYPLSSIIPLPDSKFPVFVSIYKGTADNLSFVTCRKYANPDVIFNELTLGETYFIKVFYEDINYLTDFNFEICIRENTNMNTNDNLIVSDIQIYPNPTKDKVYYKTSSKIEKIELYSLEGRILQFYKSNVEEIDISHLPSGNYILRFLTESGYIYKKIIKK